MITINLIKEPRGRARFKLPATIKADSIVALIVAAAILGVGSWFFYLRSVKETALETKETLQQQSLQLVAVRAQIQQFEAQKNMLEGRAEVIQQLKASQKGPVLMMNAIISSMPTEPRLWLDQLTQEENSVKIQGQSLDVPSIADFVANLGKSPPFTNVELEYWEQGPESVSFELSCQIRNE